MNIESGVKKVSFDYQKLLGRITEKAGTQANFAYQMELSERSVSLKLNGKRPFKQEEIMRAVQILQIPKDEIGTYFFADNVQSN